MPGGYWNIIISTVAVYLFKFILYRFPKFGRLIQGEAILLVYKGKLNRSKLREAELTFDELMEAIREHGVATVEEVDLAVLEMDGNISVLSNEFQHRTVRKRKLGRAAKPASQD